MGEDLIMDADIWFWKGPKSRDLLVKVELPPGTSFSTPWATIGKEGELLTFRPDKTPASWEARIAVGRFDVQQIEIPGAQIRVAMTGNLSDRQEEKFMLWIRESVLTVSSVLGYFPQPQPQVLIIPVGKRNQSTMFGQVTRGGGLAVSLLVDENRPLKDFTNDWTATHEFSHMLFPYVSSRDRWLSEGLASYYQNVLRARNGRLTETQAWQKLYEGFQRGENGTNGGTLAQATRDGWRSTMRVYWSGAAMMLKADMQLRENSDGKQSLDTALKSLAGCCLENGRTWRARELFTRLDELTGTRIFRNLYEAHVHEETFPDLRTTWEHLGIETHRDQVRLSDDAPLAAVRTSIMKG
jgi:predicted metalloprotease with PDZ domain